MNRGRARGGPRVLPSVLAALALVAVVFVAYAPALTAGFVWDDDDWLTDNPVVSAPDGLSRIWAGAETLQYYPLLFTTFWLEHRLWGFDPAGYHAVNVALHALNALLLGWILQRLEIRGAIWIALLFALHPVHVESVAWVTELKNVLSGSFYLGAAAAFVVHRRSGSRRLYVGSLLLFACAMLSKTATVTLPAGLALVGLWQAGRWRRADLVRLVPFFLIGFALAAVTVTLERGLIDAVRDDFDLSLVQRMTVGCRALLFYPSKLLVPYPLIFNYPRWSLDPGTIIGLWPVAGVLLIGVGSIVAWRRGARGLACALGFYAVTISPVLGVFDVYAFRYSFVADHFQYLASIGILVAAVAVARWAAATLRLPTRAVQAAGVVVLLALGVMTWQQAHAYRNLPTLWQDTLAKNPESWIAHHNLALFRMDEGELESARAHFDAALLAKPDAVESLTGRGMTLARAGSNERALADLDRAVELAPTYPHARWIRGRLLAALGRHTEAVADLDLFLTTNAGFAAAHGERARSRAALGQWEFALQDVDRAIELGAGAVARIDRGKILARMGRFERALADAEAALRLEPDNPAPYLLRGTIRQLESNDTARACADWRQACRLGDCGHFEQRCSP